MGAIINPAVTSALATLRARQGDDAVSSATTALLESPDAFSETAEVAGAPPLQPFEIEGSLELAAHDPDKLASADHRLKSAKYSYLCAVNEATTRPRMDGTAAENKANVEAWLNAEIVPKMRRDGFDVTARRDCLLITTREDPNVVSVVDVVTNTGDKNLNHQAWWGPQGTIDSQGNFVQTAQKLTHADLQGWLGGSWSFLFDLFMQEGFGTGSKNPGASRELNQDAQRAAMDEKIRLQSNDDADTLAVRPASV